MTPFSELSPLLRSFFALWALLLFLVGAGSALLAALNRRRLLAVLSAVLLLPVYFFWQVIFDFSLFGNGEKLSDFSRAAVGYPSLMWLAVFAALTALTVLLFVYCIRYDRNHITPGTIKTFLDRVPCGICCFRENGRVLFSNVCMNELCVSVTGEPLMNGNHYKDTVGNGVLTVNGKVWRFTCREMSSDGGRLYELIASDVTSEYTKTRALERDKEELSKLNEAMEEYILNIDDTVRRREILEAKVNIHDEMNRLMLSSTAVKSDDAAEFDRIFSLWEQNALLLCMEAEKTANTRLSDIERLAAALKISLILRDPLPAALNDRQRELFCSVAKEATVNAVKHARAKELIISFSEKENGVFCFFANDGMPPEKEIRFSGGLANLSDLASKQNAVLSVKNEEHFTLSLFFENQPNG